MASQSLYRKWRSQTFQELVGQDHVIQTLRNAIVEERVAHAYLFTGPRGVGKTSMARLLAKAVNCTAEKTLRPCGTCNSCTTIADGRNVDIIEMDAASHTSVEDARELIDRVQFRPSHARYKVYIIDEVHMLSTAAFNALLKTLEEPPNHAIFIMATTEVHKVPATILSRCQRFTFSRHTVAHTAEHLIAIAAQEQVQLEPGVAESIARAATGSMRDALSILEQLSSFAGEIITLAQVQRLLGMSSTEELHAMMEALIAGNMAASVNVVNSVAHQGADMRQFTRDLIDRLRLLMLTIVSGTHQLDELGEDERATFEAWAQKTSIESVIRWIKLFSSLDYQLRTSPYGHLPLELAAVEALLEPAAPVAVMAATTATTRAPVAMPTHDAPPRRVAAPAPPAAVESPAPNTPVPASSPPPKPPVVPAPPTRPAQSGGVAEQHTRLQSVELVWQSVVHDVRPHDPALQAFLRDVRPVRVEGNTVELLAMSSFHKENVEKKRNRQVIEELLFKHTGTSYTIRCVVEQRSGKKDVRSQLRKARQDPFVKATMNIFGADVIDIEEQ